MYALYHSESSIFHDWSRFATMVQHMIDSPHYGRHTCNYSVMWHRVTAQHISLAVASSALSLPTT